MKHMKYIASPLWSRNMGKEEWNRAEFLFELGPSKSVLGSSRISLFKAGFSFRVLLGTFWDKSPHHQALPTNGCFYPREWVLASCGCKYFFSQFQDFSWFTSLILLTSLLLSKWQQYAKLNFIYSFFFFFWGIYNIICCRYTT